MKFQLIIDDSTLEKVAKSTPNKSQFIRDAIDEKLNKNNTDKILNEIEILKDENDELHASIFLLEKKITKLHNLVVLLYEDVLRNTAYTMLHFGGNETQNAKSEVEKMVKNKMDNLQNNFNF